MTMKDKNLETDSNFATAWRLLIIKFRVKMFAKIANINNYVLPLPMTLSFHGNTL